MKEFYNCPFCGSERNRQEQKAHLPRRCSLPDIRRALRMILTNQMKRQNTFYKLRAREHPLPRSFFFYVVFHTR